MWRCRLIYDKILEETNDGVYKLALTFKEEINKKLCLGMSEYACVNGTLSAGHEFISDAARYFQAIKECWTIANSIEAQEIQSMEAQAELIESQSMKKYAFTKAKKLKAEAAIKKASMKLTNALVSIQDLKRQLHAFDKVRLELQPVMDSKYPNGFEQAQKDIWKAVYDYRANRRKLGSVERLDNIPMDKYTKAELGIINGFNDELSWLLASEDGKEILKSIDKNGSLDRNDLLSYIGKVKDNKPLLNNM